MTNQIKVYMQYPWKIPDSPYYKYLIENPPKKIMYLNVSTQKGAITNRNRFLLSNFAKKSIRQALRKIRFPILNTHFTTSKEKYDLIHCAHCLSKNKSPWVVDIESWWQFWISGEEGKLGKRKVREILLSKNCKKLLPWSEVIKEDILKIFPEVKDKIEVVFPAVPLPKFNKKKNKKVTILYASRYFWIKGGLVALETLRRIKKKYDVNIIFISDVPKEIKDEYKDIQIQEIVPHDKLVEYYKNSDIFFYPSFVDTFGFSLLEAMSYGLSILTVNTGGTTNCREIIKSDKTGIVIDFPYYSGNEIYNKCHHIGKEELKLIDDLYRKLSLLVEDSNLRKIFFKNCIEEIKNGKFSIEKRNRKLRKIYEDAIK